MAKRLDIIESQLEVGDVKTITNGNSVKFVELLFSPTTKIQFAQSDDNKNIILSVSDNQLNLPQLECAVDKSTVRDLIINLKTLYNQLEESEE